MPLSLRTSLARVERGLTPNRSESLKVGLLKSELILEETFTQALRSALR